MGREAITLRLVAAGAFVVLLLWPEALVGPSFQLSFAAVAAIVALHEQPTVRGWFLKRDEAWWRKVGRELGSLLLTGLVVEAALAPIALYHFHKSGLYGAFANIVAIPLTTFVIMPAEALALAFDAVGLGAPFWWVTGKALALLLWIAHTAAGAPGSLAMLPAMPGGAYGLMIAGGLWFALWRTRVRLAGIVPFAVGRGMGAGDARARSAGLGRRPASRGAHAGRRGRDAARQGGRLCPRHDGGKCRGRWRGVAAVRAAVRVSAAAMRAWRLIAFGRPHLPHPRDAQPLPTADRATRRRMPIRRHRRQRPPLAAHLHAALAQARRADAAQDRRRGDRAVERADRHRPLTRRPPPVDDRRADGWPARSGTGISPSRLATRADDRPGQPARTCFAACRSR